MKSIDLALSGGGVRAMVFHLGVLGYLAEQGLLERIGRISSVSGGSLVTGLILKEAGLKWPSSDEFRQSVYPSLRRKLCSRGLIAGMLRQALRPGKLRHLLYRANLLALTLEKEWGVTERLSELPAAPEILLEGTCAETGRRFRFTRADLGDYETGYMQSGDFPLASALAVSAAFPGGIGPLLLESGRYTWKKRTDWDDPATEQSGPCAYTALHLYDGGVYDNLGLEPFFDAGSAAPKTPGNYLLVSDAGSAFSKGFSYFRLNPLRLKRVLDIVMEQCRALRVRGVVNYLKSGSDLGVYIWINSAQNGPEYETMRCYAANFPTTLRTLKEREFDDLARCGRLAAKARMRLAANGEQPPAGK